jgi:hypothetical protein
MTSMRAAAPRSVARGASASYAPAASASHTIASSTVKANRRKTADAG